MNKRFFLVATAYCFVVSSVGGFISPKVVHNRAKVSIVGAAPANSSSSIGDNTRLSEVKERIDDGLFEQYEVYSRSLSPRKERAKILKELDGNGEHKRWWNPARFLSRKTKPGKLILLRCGESTFNANGTFTGWLDPGLTERGIQQCQHAASVLQSEGFEPDVVYTSRLQRAIKSAWFILEELHLLYLPVYKTYRLNQRHYGLLQGLSKEKTAAEFGWNVVNAWRNSLKARPPSISENDVNHPRYDRRYADIDIDTLPSTESLLDCQERARPLWEHKIKLDIMQGKTVLVVAHRDALRGLVKSIEGLDDNEIEDVRVPKGIPFVYRFEEVKGGPDDGALKPIKPGPKDHALTEKHTSAAFLESPVGLKKAIEEIVVESTTKHTHQYQNNTRHHSLRETVAELRSKQNLIQRRIDADDDDIKLKSVGNNIVHHERWTDDPCEFEEYEYDELADFDNADEYKANVVAIPLPSTGMKSMFDEGEPFVVLIRHGRTPHNNLGLFTGWEDPPLAEGGVEDAKNAGRLLRRHNFEFDVVYTSWLTRAIQTAYYCLDELDSVWLPIVKSWRLNERMYGNLTGKSKKRVANDYGEDQLKKWRRGYTIRPPPTSVYSPNYPGNDNRRTKHFDDLRISLRQTINRSLEQGKFEIHRKFPKTESLKDCMDRSIPFYTEQIYKEAVQKGKRVLITSHENAIRGILMHLCDIPEEAMNQLHLPNGLPLVYSPKGRCITLLDDGSGKDPMDVHDFGPAAKYLFKPCELDDEFYNSMLKP